MSNIVLGDAVQNLGEYLPNVYIESIEVSEFSELQLRAKVFYSLIFLIDDEYSVEDISKNLQDINIIFVFVNSNSSKAISKQELISGIGLEAPINIQNGTLSQIDMIPLFSKLNDGDYIDDLYDEQDRRIFKIVGTYEQNLSKATYQNFNAHCYTFSSVLSVQDFQDLAISSENLAYLNTSNFAYEKIMSPGLSILKEDDVIYLDAQGQKYGQVPILGLDRNYYKNLTVRREQIISRVNNLLTRFSARKTGPLTDSVNSIKYVLSTESDTENLLVELDKARRSFPNKTNNNPVGNLYAAYSKLLQNLNSSFPAAERVTKSRYTTGKVLDLRTAPFIPYEYVPTPGIDYIPEDSFFAFRERAEISAGAIMAGVDGAGTVVEVTVPSRDVGINRGMFFFRYEESLKKFSNISQIIDLNRLFQILSTRDRDQLRRVLFSYLRIQSLELKKLQGTTPIQTATLNYGTDRDNRKSPPTFTIQGFGDALHIESSDEVSQSIKEYNYALKDPDERILCFQFTDIDKFSSEYDADRMEEFGAVPFTYSLTIYIYDETEQFMSFLNTKYNDTFEELKEYRAIANQICSYNNLDNKFNDFFINAIREEYPPNMYPWEFAPTLYAMMSYLITDNQGSYSEVAELAKSISATISPESGNISSIDNFITQMQTLVLPLSNLRTDANDLGSTNKPAALSQSTSVELVPFEYRPSEEEEEIVTAETEPDIDDRPPDQGPVGQPDRTREIAILEDRFAILTQELPEGGFDDNPLDETINE